MDYELAYSYGAASRLEESAGLALATSGGSTPEGEASHPYFFSGFMERPDVVAAGLLAVARVARTRFYMPPGMVALPGGGLTRVGALDPVVTSTEEGLRFESFSACCGVYARLDVDASALDASHRAVGVTNVDVNQPLRAALASLRADSSTGARSPARKGCATGSPRAPTATGLRCPPIPTRSASTGAPARGG